MKQLELKHLAPYLAYDLKVTFENDEYVHTLVGLENSNVGILLISPFGDYGRSMYELIKPLLHPLSDLAKEIEHNGERFVPIERLFELKFKNHKSKKYYTKVVPNWIECSHLNTSHTFTYFLNGYAENFHETEKQLLKWHFDIEGLIPKGLAIDINEFKKASAENKASTDLSDE